MAETDTTSTTGGRQVETVSTADWYRILQSDVRRTAIAVLGSSEFPVHLEDLATRIRTLESPPATAAGESTDRLMVMLQHIHLPLMADAGVIRYDVNRREVTGVNTALVEAYLG